MVDVPESIADVQRRYVPSPVYLVDRFDRIPEAQGWQRRHAIDACRSPAVARSRLYGWLVFNVLVGNSDAHLKNLSFLVSHEGVQLAPFYDLLSVAAYDTPAFDKQGWPAQTRLAWPILGVRHFSDINRTLLLEAGAALSRAKGTAERLLEHLRSRAVQEAEALYAGVKPGPDPGFRTLAL